MKYTCWFSDEHATDLALVGGKGANLSRLSSAGFPVPPGFCISASAYRYVLKVTGLQQVIGNLVDEIDFENQEDIAAKSAAIRKLIEQQPVPSEIAGEILENYFDLGRQLDQRHLEGTPVAVRSSATAEDLPEASFAGQQDTYLNVRGGINLLESTRRCWSSLWTERALTYRWRQGFEHLKVNVAVVVQAMVDSEVSGILFTANPINGNNNECVINASWGLGEAIVSGIVNPDTLVVDKRTGLILQQDIGTKERQVVYSRHAGSEEEEVAMQLQGQCALAPAEAADLTALATRIEQLYEFPQDIEWARKGKKWYILQARPITTLEKQKKITDVGGIYSRAMFVEIFPDGLSPSFLSVVCPLLESMLQTSFRELGFKKQPDSKPVRTFLNQPYLSIGYIEEALKDLDPVERAHLVAKFSNIFAQEEDQPLSLARLKMALHLFRFVRRFQQDIPALLARYHNEIERMNAVPVQDMTDQDLLQRVHHISFMGAGPLLNNDFLLIAAIGVYRSILTKLLTHEFGDRATDLTNSLLSGVSGNVVMETNKLIWDLSQTARNQPQVKRAIQELEPAAALSELRELPEAIPFLEQLADLMRICGHREQRFDICYPTWGEDPAQILVFVRGYLDMKTSADPAQREKELVAQRESLTSQIEKTGSKSHLSRLMRQPLITYFLRQTQWLVRERDTMHFEWTRIFPPARRFQLEIGRRWQRRKLINHPEDIFFLTLPEQEEIARFPRPCQDLVGQRREAYAANLSGPWPDVISDGVAVSGQPGPVFKSPTGEMDQITGIAGSPGHAEGVVRIILDPKDFKQLQPGEILVAPMTNPAWTPLFAIAGGIITETGGILSHGAIVAREYGIPAVMSVPGVTRLLSDGDMIGVDGNRGLVIQKQIFTQPPHKIAQFHTK